MYTGCLNHSDPVVKKYFSKYGVRNTYEAYIRNGYVLPDMEDIQENSVRVGIDVAKSYIHNVLPKSIPVENLDRLNDTIGELGIKGSLLGAFFNDVIYLNDNTNLNTAYHETFHAVFRKFLTDSQQRDLLAIGQLKLNARLERSGSSIQKMLASKREAGLYSELSNSDAYKRLYEEELAEQFVKWKNEKKEPKTIVDRFFQWLKDLANWFKKDWKAKALFQRIDNGYFADHKFVDNNYDGGVPEIAPVLIKYGQKPIEGKLYDQFLSKEEGDEIIRMISATYRYIKDAIGYREDPFQKTFDYLGKKYTITSDDVYNYADSQGLSEDEADEQYEELEAKLKENVGYPKLFEVFSFPSEIQKLKDATADYLENFNENISEDENEVTETNKKDTDYDKEANQFDPFLNGSSFVKAYIGLAYYINPVETITPYVYETTNESGETITQTLRIPSIYAIDARTVYNGIIRSINNVMVKENKLVKLYNFANLKSDDETDTILNKSVNAFLKIFLRDTFGKNQAEAEDLLSKGIYPSELIRQMSVAQARTFYRVMQAFDLYVLDNKFLLLDPKNGDVIIGNANKNNAAKNQIDIWRASFNATYNNYDDLKKAALGNFAIRVADAYKKQNDNNAGLIMQINQTLGSNINPGLKYHGLVSEYFKLIGINLFPQYVYLSSQFNDKKKLNVIKDKAKAAELKRILDAYGFDGKTALESDDIVQIFRRLQEGSSPFDITVETMEEATTKKKSKDNSSTSRIKDISAGNSVFTEDLYDLGFIRQDGEMVYNQQFKNYFHQVIGELSDPETYDRYTRGEVLLIEEGKYFNYDENFYKENRLLNDPNFRTLALTGNGIPMWASEGMRQTYLEEEAGKVNEKNTYNKKKEGAVFSEMIPREFLLMNLNNFTKGRETIIRRNDAGDLVEIETAPVMLGLLETARTALFFQVPTLNGLYVNGLTDKGKEIIANEINKELVRIAQAYLDDKISRENTPELGASEFYYKKYGYLINKFHPKSKGSKTRAFQLSDTVKYMLDGYDITQLVEPIVAKEYSNYLEAARDANDRTIDYRIPFQNVLREDAMEHIVDQSKTLLKEFLRELDLSGYVDKTYKGKNSPLDKVYYGLTKADFENRIGQAFFSMMFQSIAMKQIIIGDPALNYKNDGADPTKRAKSINAAIQSIEHNGSVELGLEPWSQTKILVTQEMEVPSTYANGGKKTSIADAQMYMSISGARNTLFGLGRLSPALNDVLLRIEKGEQIDEEEIFNTSNGMIERGEMLNSLKLIYRDGHRTLKISSFLLTRELTSVYHNNEWIARPGYENLHQLRTYMEDSKTEFVLNESGSKTLTLNVLPQEKDGSFIYNNAKPTLHATRNFGLQLEVPSNKLKQKDPTQLQRLADNEQDLNLNVWFNNSWTPVSNVVQNYHDMMYSRSVGEFYKSFNEIYDLNNAEQDWNEAIDKGEIGFNLKNFVKIAVKSLKASGGDPQLIKLFEEQKNPNIPLMKNKFSQLYLAFFSKSAFSQKVPGHSLVLVSPYGQNVVKKKVGNSWKVIRKGSTEYNSILGKDLVDLSNTIYVYNENMEKERVADYNTATKSGTLSHREEFSKLEEGEYFIDALRHNVPEYDSSGKIIGWYTETLMPYHFRELINSPEGEMLLSKALGVRIPSQDKHSFVNLRFVDTLPIYYGSAVTVAKELIELSGADFDIDKLVVLVQDFFMENGTPTAYSNMSIEREFQLFVNDLKEHNNNFARLIKFGYSESKALKALKLPVSVSDYKNTLEKLNVKTLLKPLANNNILEARMALLNNDYTLNQAKTAIEPATQDKLIDVENYSEDGIDLFKVDGVSVFTKAYNKYPVNSLAYQYMKFRDNTVGKDNIGIAVNGNIVGSELIKNNISLLEEFRVFIDHLEVANFGEYKNLQGVRILDVISTLISAATDEAKDGNNAKYGLSPNALKAVVPMVLARAKLETAVAFVNQPILKEFFRLKELQQAKVSNSEERKEIGYASDKTLIDKALKTIDDRFTKRIKSKNQTITNSNYDLKELSKVLRQLFRMSKNDDANITEDDYLETNFIQLQKKVMDDYNKLAAVYQHMSTLSNRIKLNAKLPSRIEDFNSIITKFDIAANKESKPFPYYPIVNKGLNAAMFQLGNKLSDISKLIFVNEMKEFKAVRNAVISNLKRNLNPEEVNTIIKDVESYVYFQLYKKWVNDNQSYELETLTLGLIYPSLGGETIAQLYNKVLSKNPNSSIRKIFIPNQIQLRTGKYIKSKQNIEGLQFRTIGKLQQQELGDISDSILELLSSTNYDERKLGSALWTYFIVKDGFHFQFGSVAKTLPTLMFDGLSSAINNYVANPQESYPIINPLRLIELISESVQYDTMVQYINSLPLSPAIERSPNQVTFDLSKIAPIQTFIDGGLTPNQQKEVENIVEKTKFGIDPKAGNQLIFLPYFKSNGILYKLVNFKSHSKKKGFTENEWSSFKARGYQATYIPIGVRGSASASPSIDTGEERPLLFPMRNEYLPLAGVSNTVISGTEEIEDTNIELIEDQDFTETENDTDLGDVGDVTSDNPLLINPPVDVLPSSSVGETQNVNVLVNPNEEKGDSNNDEDKSTQVSCNND